MSLKNKKVMIVGFGSSGIAIAKFLTIKGAKVTVLEKNRDKISKNFRVIKSFIRLKIDFKIGIHQVLYLIKSDLIILSPGVDHRNSIIRYASSKGITVIGEAEFVFNYLNKPIIGVTGTNGKTTTVKLIEKMFLESSKRVFLGGNIGRPLTEALYLLDKLDVIVVELSSFQLDTIKKFRVNTSILLNIKEDHINRYNGFNDYLNSKSRIFSNQTENDILIYNSMDINILKIIYNKKVLAQQKTFFDQKNMDGARLLRNHISIFNRGDLIGKFSLIKSKMNGSHNKENIAAASIAALSHGASFLGVQKSINEFIMPKHRMEKVRFFRGILFVNDSKATNLHATISAINYFATSIILIMGGVVKNSNFRLIANYMGLCVKAIVAIGAARKKIKDDILFVKKKSKIVTIPTMEEAVYVALNLAKDGDVILLSPSCSSFDQFINYEDRGDQFKEIVNNLI